jgi:flagellar biosynthetic protein FliR
MTLDDATIGAFLATLVRATALTATAPVIGEAGVPMRAKVIFVLVITGAVASNRAGVPLASLPLMAAIELCVGLVTGMTARFIMARAAVAGQLMGLSLGFGFASQYDVHAGESAITLRTLLTTISALAFLAVGGLEAIVRGVAAPAHVLDLVSFGPQLLREGASAMGHGLTLAAPVVLASLVGNIGLAVMNRAAPAINVFSIALSAVLIIGGTVLLGASGGVIGSVLSHAREAAAVFVR